MKDKTKELRPGDAVSVRIPVDAPQRYINYLNEKREVKRNKHVLNLLFSKIDEELSTNENILKINLPGPLNDKQRTILSNHLSEMLKVLMADQETVAEDQAGNPSFHDLDVEGLAGLIEED